MRLASIFKLYCWVVLLFEYTFLQVTGKDILDSSSEHRQCDESKGNTCRARNKQSRKNSNKKDSVSVEADEGLIIKSNLGPFALSAYSPNGGALLHVNNQQFSSSILEMVTSRDPTPEFKIMKAISSKTKEVTFEVDGTGRLNTLGGIQVGNTSLIKHIESDLPQIVTPKATIGNGGLSIKKGPLAIENGQLQMKGNGGITIENGNSSFKSSGALPILSLIREVKPHKNPNATFLIEQSHENSNYAVDHLEFKTNNRSVLKVTSDGTIKSDGGIILKKGGILVETGGMKISSGGIEVDGGFKLNSGSLNLGNLSNGLSLSGGGIESNTSDSATPAFTGRAKHPTFQGSILKLIGPGMKTKQDEELEYNFIEISKENNSQGSETDMKQLFKLTSKGDIFSAGNIISDKDMFSNGQIHMKGGSIIGRRRLMASDKIVVEDISTVSFLEISDDGVHRNSLLTIMGTPVTGQFLFLMNNDLDTITGDAFGVIPPKSLILYLYSDPNGWVDVTAFATHQRNLKSVTNLEAENDLDIGSHAFSCKNLFLSSKRNQDNKGELSYFGPGGMLMGDKSLKFDISTGTLQISRFSANEFFGNSLDFRGGTISNAALVNATVNELKHLNVGSIGILDMASGVDGGKVMVYVDERGRLRSAKHMRWDEDSEELKIPSISSFSRSGIKVRSNLDLSSNIIRNVRIEKGTVLEDLIFQEGTIKNTVLENVTASNLKLGSVEMQAITLTELGSFAENGKLVEIGEGGKLFPSEYFQKIEGKLSIIGDVQFEGGQFDLKGGALHNANIVDGSISGKDIEISARSLEVEKISITKIKNNKKLIGDSLLIVDEEGNIKRGLITTNKNGALGDFHVQGNILFRPSTKSSNSEHKRGSIVGAIISGGDIEGLEKLDVVGETFLSETFIGGSLTVSGSVLGSGPYVDVSDSRVKKNVQSLSSNVVLQKLLKMRGVAYELDLDLDDKMVSKEKFNFLKSSMKERKNSHTKKTEFGFIAQEVETEFPELVETMEDGYKGLQYARFVPLIVEAMKDIHKEMEDMKQRQMKLELENIFLRSQLGKLVEDSI